jgi:hypothetical protein
LNADLERRQKFTACRSQKFQTKGYDCSDWILIEWVNKIFIFACSNKRFAVFSCLFCHCVLLCIVWDIFIFSKSLIFVLTGKYKNLVNPFNQNSVTTIVALGLKFLASACRKLLPTFQVCIQLSWLQKLETENVLNPLWLYE